MALHFLFVFVGQLSGSFLFTFVLWVNGLHVSLLIIGTIYISLTTVVIEGILGGDVYSFCDNIETTICKLL